MGLATYSYLVQISAPGWSNILVDYSLFMMQIYLTKVWGLGVTHAAGIVNIWGGISLILPLFLLFLVDGYLGNIKMLVISSIATAVGIGFIAISTPPVFTVFTRGTCNRYEGGCIGHTQKVLFYIGMISAALGMSGNLVSAEKLIQEKINKETLKTRRLRVTRFILVALPHVIGAVGIPNLSWSLQLGIPGICTLVAMFLFLSGLCCYGTSTPPKGSPLTTLFRVFVAAARNRPQPSDGNNKEPTGVTHTPVPPDEIQHMEGSQPSDDNNKEPTGVTHTRVPPDEIQRMEFTDTRFLRCLEKAAPIESSKDLKDRWRVCTIEEVEEVKIAVRMLTMCPTFIAIGVVASTSNTYFLAQADEMKIDKIGNWSIPLPTFLLFFHIAKWMFMYLYKNVLETSLKKYAPPTSIGSAMVLSVLCCSTAAAIEKWRRSQENTTLDVSRLDAAAAAAPSSIDAGPSINAFWLLFQFFLLAGVEELSERGIDAFFSEQATESMRDYLSNITKGLTGLGFMLGVGLIKATGGEEQTRKHWQRTELDGIRLDKYYWFLAILSSANLTVYSFVAFLYRYRQPQATPKPSADAAPNAAESSSSCFQFCSSP